MKKEYQKVNNDISKNKYDSALNKLDLILNHNNYDIFALTKKGNLLLLKKDYYGALNCFDNILELFQDNLDALVGKSRALFGLKQYLDAFDVYNKSIELRENSVDVNFYNELFKLSEKGNLPLPAKNNLEDKKASKIKNSSDKYIIFANNYYRVHKLLNGKQKNFGSFENIENAYCLRDLLIENDWDETKIPKKYFFDHSNSRGKHGKYISFMDSDDYVSLNTFQEVYEFFEEHNEEIDLVSIPIMFFERSGYRRNPCPKQSRGFNNGLDAYLAGTYI